MPSFWSLYIYGTLAVFPILMNFFYRLLFQTDMKIKFLLQNDPILRILSFNAFVRSWAKIATSARHAMFVLAPRHYKSIGLSLISHGMSRWRVLSPQVSH